MRRLLEPALAAAAALTAARATRRMAADYWDTETLTPRTVALVYSAGLANAGAYVLAVRHRSWPLPLPTRTAALGGAAVAAALVTRGRHTRNPRTVGLVAALTGIGITARSGLACTIAVAVWAAVRQPMPADERHLARMLGNQHSRQL
ncbi:hypothetical protein [Actinophytocola algeriensis]|uniref:Protein-S-isoprenylcysteine O-methyltransferase Ste14 n=1 Tax=Actinophytocola algeriensis TaxID=1768010 RepID=A0A7W7Q373_9PSEU|nr:hypothetical protein [Actinophytocola algeriensis]MBB4906038.1 protein-S-isoprenylcysteine O-methyltransferase Ste14 [Actinophytocola algeriensis]MBE1472277.1 protein-S-isoprenylcysteine O-methyltransferase Ste14 [Actinophytocola algeriensis]